MSLPAGTRLGPYEILAPLGAGGMGEVFRARDTRLGRTVAVKILHRELAGQAEGRARFELEARTIASLGHPHICTLHDVGEADLPSPAPGPESPAPSPICVNYLVMELLEGETLAERLARGPLAVEETVAYAIQIADALGRAHSQGIVHRDLKPSNVMLARSGSGRQSSLQVKLLDFGLARLRHGSSPGDAGVTQAASLTSPGLVLGTLPYMAPEQLEGQEADARTDLFAFGAVVYEMATGRRAFDASSQAELIGAIVKSDPPPIATSNPAVPPALDRLVKTCLAKNPDERWSSAHDVQLLLRDIAADLTGPAPPAVARGRGRERVAWAVAAAAVIAAGVLAARVLWPRVDAPLDFVSILPPAGTALAVGEAPQVSPDGRRIAFVATDRSGRTLLYVRALGSLAARALPGSDDATLPFWAPDSRRLGFFARGSLKTIDVSDGTPQTIASVTTPRGGTWGPDDTIIFVPYPNEFPLQIPASGGKATPVPVPDATNDRRWFPSFLPDGHHYLYLAVDSTRRTGTAIRVASLGSTDTVDVVPSKTSAVFAEPGYLIFRRETALVAQRFDVRRLRLDGAPIVIAEQVGVGALSWQGSFSAASNGALAYLEPDPGWRLVWFDRAGRRLGTLLEPGQYNTVCVTPDGRRIVYDLADRATGNVDVWMVDLLRGIQTRLTFDPAVDFYALCSPTGDETVFASLRTGPPSLFRLTVTAPGSEIRLPQEPAPKIPTDWSRDGRLLVYSAYNPRTRWDIWVMPLSGGGQAFPFAATPAEERNGRLSPDGRWMAYTILEDAVAEVYVQPFPQTGAKWQISRGGGRQPVWSPDGRELFYVSSDRAIVAVEIGHTSSGFTVGSKRVIADANVAGLEVANSFGGSFALMPDGERLLVNGASDATRPITLVLNWAEVLKRKAE